jgi:hypothetical protein
MGVMFAVAVNAVAWNDNVRTIRPRKFVKLRPVSCFQHGTDPIGDPDWTFGLQHVPQDVVRCRTNIEQYL